MLAAAGLVAISLALRQVIATGPPVKVSVRSSWPAPPLLLEVVESVAFERPDAFFPLLESVTNPENIPPQPHTPKVLYEHALRTALSTGYLGAPGALSSVELNLALHAATPKIEAFYQYYVDRYGEENGEEKCGGGSWVDWYGEAVCDIQGLEDAITKSEQEAEELVLSRPKVLPFDHIYPAPSETLSPPSRTAIFYASPDSARFWELHSFMLNLARSPGSDFEYIFRHMPPRDRDEGARNYLSGYGVSLDLKKMDYLALDDRHASSTENDSVDTGAAFQASTDTILALLDALPETAGEENTAPLTEDELLEIGLQATQLISTSPDPLTTLSHLAENFPAYAPRIARRVVVNSSLEEEVHANQLRAPAGVNIMWLNGAVVKEADISPFGLLRTLRKERGLITGLTTLGLTGAQAVEFISHPAVAAAQSQGAVVDGMFDASDRPEGGDVLVWWNDLTKDTRYKHGRWQTSIFALQRQMYPGQFHQIRLNIFNVVVSVDLSQTSSLHFVAGTVSNIINRSFPFRWGIVPNVETTAGRQMARLFYWLIDHYGRAKTMQFFKQIAQLQVPPQLLPPQVEWALVKKEFQTLVSENPLKKEDDEEEIVVDFGAIVGTGDEQDERIDKARAYGVRLGTDLASSPQGHAFVNGKHFDIDDTFLRYMQGELAQQLQFLQERLYEGSITEDTEPDIDTYFYDLSTTATRRNRYIYPSTGTLRVYNLFDLFSQAKFDASPSRFVNPPDSTQIPLSIYVVADLDSDEGVALMKEALQSMEPESKTRISFIHNPVNSSATVTDRPHMSWFLSHLISASLLPQTSPSHLLRALGLESIVDTHNNPQVVLAKDEGSLDKLTGGVGLNDIDAAEYASYEKSCRLVARELGLAPGEQALIVNGRIVGPFPAGEFLAEDLQTLETYELQRRAQPVLGALQTVLSPDAIFDRDTFANLVSIASSIVWSAQLPDPSENGLFDTPMRLRTRSYKLLEGNHTALEFGDEKTAICHISVILDPVSEAAQKWSTMIEWLASLPDVFVELHLNPARYKEIPLKRFYRYNLASRLSFDDDGKEIPAQTVFNGLPVEPIYTLGVEVLQSWLVRPREALYDLDNIQLGSLAPEHRRGGVEAIFDLDYLVVEGHARDTYTGSPPRGVQLELTDGKGKPIDDTQVVATLGYLQFKARPGVFQLGIREGRGREIYKMESVGNEGWHSPSVEEAGDEVTVTSFEGLTLYPRLARQSGMEDADVLADLDDADSEPQSLIKDVVSKVLSFFKFKQEEPKDIVVSDSDQADINIFTVASGLLYERFVSIMILSVMRNTNSTVKFWFIENFLSPSFLEFIPHLASAYNFKYELVTYKWPSFIRPQKEKQRIIWAYKILFLDVLFPMDLKKVIFVDADQIVRADLKELVDLDLHGAPYGYTPMGDDNEEMEGFRFWKTGYWKDFLRGRPYHISALYVIDLVRFRQIAAGDILRQQYQQLSADPNSLANLDQDLPNNLQREVPIFSLPEDWLWCETWCSKDRLHRAKTIDLCQNPLTKEPKLARARQIPEWEEYDSEIARFARKLADEGLIRSQAAAADANVLANVGNVAVPHEAGAETGEGDDSVDSVQRDEL
ncbi:glycosyltransferase family 24 protein [Plicaturopsis crispa FD-325 SS-3]|nr:glycosyltransferase family 24 protein [Plicaturopsis crispa FD-325 SS-3]